MGGTSGNRGLSGSSIRFLTLPCVDHCPARPPDRGGAMNQKENREQREREKIEDELDRELEQTFPGSDPLNITRSIPGSQITPNRVVVDHSGTGPDKLGKMRSM